MRAASKPARSMVPSRCSFRDRSLKRISAVPRGFASAAIQQVPTEGVGEHRCDARRHGDHGPGRMDQASRGEGYTDAVEEKGQGQVLQRLAVAHRSDVDSIQDSADTIADKDDVRGLDGDVGTGADGHAHVGPGHR